MDSSDARCGRFWWCYAGIGFVAVLSGGSYALIRLPAESLFDDMLPEFPHVAALGLAVLVLLSGVFSHAIYVVTALNIPPEAPQERRGMSPDFKVTGGLILALVVLDRIASNGALVIGLALVLAAGCFLVAVRLRRGWHWPGTTAAHMALGLVFLVNLGGWLWWAQMAFGAPRMGFVGLLVVLLPLWGLAYSMGFWTATAREFEYQCEGGKAGSGRLPQRSALLASGALLALSVLGWSLVPPSGLMVGPAVAPTLELHDAIERGDVAEVERLLDKCPYTIWADEVMGISLLTGAALYDQTDIVALLLARGARVNVRDPLKRIALHNTAEFGSVKSARLLLDHGSEVNVTDMLGWTPLLGAVRSGNQELMALLLQHGAEHDVLSAAAAGDVDALQRILHGAPLSTHSRDRWEWTPLHMAASLNRPEAARVLIAAGADVNARAARGRTPLFLAAKEGDRAVAEVLLEKGADPDLAEESSGWLPLHRAVESGSLPLVRLLLAHGADPEAETARGLTPMVLAELHEHGQIAELLQRHGAERPQFFRAE